MIKNKKGFIPILLTFPIMVVLLIAVLLILVFFFGMSFFLAKNAFTVLGMFLSVIGALGLFKGFNFQIGMTLLVVGIMLLILPFLFSSLGGVTLGMVLT